MNSKKCNQLIGFITLILLALLIAPYVITHKSKQVESTIPLLPSADNINNQLEQNSDDLDALISSVDNTQIDTTDDDASNTTIDSANDQPSVNNTSPIDKNFVVQLVALKNKQKIDELVALLRLYNYDAYTVPTIPQEGTVTRLFIGPYSTREQANIVIIDLEHLTKLKGFTTTK